MVCRSLQFNAVEDPVRKVRKMNMLAAVRGGPLDILGGGCHIQKKFMQAIELEKKIPASAWRKKKYSYENI